MANLRQSKQDLMMDGSTGEKRADSADLISDNGYPIVEIPWSSCAATSGRDLYIGAGGSLLLHLLFFLALTASPFAQTGPSFRSPFMTVNLVHPGGGSTAGDSGGGEAAAEFSMEETAFEEPAVSRRESPLPPPLPAEPVTPKAPQSRRSEPTVSKILGKPGARSETPRSKTVAGVSSKEGVKAPGTQAAAPQSLEAPPGKGFEGHGGTSAGGEGETGASKGSPAGGASGLNSANEFNASQVDRAPIALRKVEPLYPLAARRRSLTGKVVVKLLVDPEGRVRKPSIVEAQPQGVFEESVLRAVEQWMFSPGYYRGKPVSTWIIVPVQFRLSG